VTVRYELGRPFAFTQVEGPGLIIYRDVLPWLTVAAAAAAYWVLPVRVPLVGAASASSLLIPFFAGLPGFFIAALAAVATFHGVDLDREMNEVTVEMRVRGGKAAVSPTLRVFLCYLFAYLTAISFLGFFLCSATSLLSGNIHTLTKMIAAGRGNIETAIMFVARSGFVIVATLIGARVVFCTALGLYFLSERVHQDLNGPTDSSQTPTPP
jgi:hypothetical protein